MKQFLFTIALFMILQFSFAQITTTKVTKKKKETQQYDSLLNYLGQDVYKYIGQDLYVVGKPETLREYGYEGFFKKYKKNISAFNNLYKRNGYFSNYSDLAGKTFTVLSVLKHPEENIYKDKYILELFDKVSKERVYFIYDSGLGYCCNDGESFTLFPFIVVGYFEKLKQMFVGQEFVFAKKILGNTVNLSTGAKINYAIGQKWKCIDLTIEEEYYRLTFIIENPFLEKTLILFKDFTGNFTYSFDDAEKYNNKFGEQIWHKILENIIEVGFTKEMVLLSWGEPEDINKNSSGSTEWIYGDKHLYFDDEILTSWQEQDQ